MAKMNPLVVVTLVVVIAAAGLFTASQLGVKFTSASVTGDTSTPPTSDLRTCQGITSLRIPTAVRNPLNSTTQYLAAKVDAVVGGQIVGTVTSTAGATLTFANLDFPCTLDNFNGDIYVVAGATQNSVKDTYAISGTSVTKTVAAPPASNIRLTWLDFATGVNTSEIGTTTTQGTATALSAGSSANAKLQIDVPTTAFTQYGATDLGVLIAVNTVNTAAYTDKAVSISSSDLPLTEVSCADYAKIQSVDNAKRCYKTRAISTNDAAVIMNVRVSNDAGTSAGSSDDPVIYFEPLQYFEDTDGTIKIGAFNAGGTAVGLTHSSATYNAS
jgi:hypothetical protein